MIDQKQEIKSIKRDLTMFFFKNNNSEICHRQWTSAITEEQAQQMKDIAATDMSSI